MRVAIGMLHHETNTLTPIETQQDDFDVAYGNDILDRIAVTQLFMNAGCEIIPTLYANALPSGVVKESVYLGFRDYIIDVVSKAGKLDGIWLYLHGAMEVRSIGSGEGDLVAALREIVGNMVPISLALDLHANLSDSLVRPGNYICGYRTAPHVDQQETQLRAGRLLLEGMTNGFLPEPVVVRPPVLLSGDMVTTTIDPGKSLMEETIELESDPGIAFASLFVGQPWVDAHNTGPSVVVGAFADKELAVKKARRISKRYWDVRREFDFEEEATTPVDAIEKAFASRVGPVFISDSGDNTTAGAPGDNPYMLSELMKRRATKTLVAGITDSSVVQQCETLTGGELIHIRLGGQLSAVGCPSIETDATFQHMARIIGWYGEDADRAVVLKIQEIDVLVTKRRCGIVSQEIIRSVGIEPLDYHVIVVKLGYLWDDLRKISQRSILALTNGASAEDMQSIPFRHIRRPMYPVDREFDWDPFAE